jgi:hypothetical protein
MGSVQEPENVALFDPGSLSRSLRGTSVTTNLIPVGRLLLRRIGLASEGEW